MQRRRNHPVFGRDTRVLSEAVKSSPSPCKLDHGGLEPNAIAIYEEVMYRMLPLIHSSHLSNKNSSGSQHFHYHAYVQIRRLHIIYFFSSTCTASFDIHVDIALHTSSPFACTLVPFDENRRSVSQRSEAKACSLATPYFVSER